MKTPSQVRHRPDDLETSQPFSKDVWFVRHRPDDLENLDRYHVRNLKVRHRPDDLEKQSFRTKL